MDHQIRELTNNVSSPIRFDKCCVPSQPTQDLSTRDVAKLLESKPLNNLSVKITDQVEKNGPREIGLPASPGEGVPSSGTREAFARMALCKLWLVLVMTLGFTIVLLVASHLTQSLTLRVEAYHALYNLMTLGGCLYTMKISQRPSNIRNTFGWARMQLLSCLCTLVFIYSLCFSVVLESIKTAAHAGHQHPMQYPLPVIALGALGLLLNSLVFCLIGGYTHHQGCFLENWKSGVWVQRNEVTGEDVQAGKRTLLRHSVKAEDEVLLAKSYQGVRGVWRDISGLLAVMICATVVLWDTRPTVALYVDPGFAVFSASILLILSFPYGKECCRILLQTVPGSIDVQSFSTKLLQEFPEVVNVHHLHIWSLTPGKVIATAHIVYSSSKAYRSSKDALEQFFLEEEINQVTLQPEFLGAISPPRGCSECLLRCGNEHCRPKECCAGCVRHRQDSETGLQIAPCEDSKLNCTLNI